VRVLVSTTPPRAMSVRERGFLAGRLAEEEAWPELWRLARDLPFAEALAALGPVAGWCPPGVPREEFDRLLRVRPDRVPAALSSLRPRRTLRPEVDITYVEQCALSPDGTRLAVTGRSRTSGDTVLIEYALPSGDVVASYTSEGATEQWRELIHTGDAVIAIVGRPGGRLVRYADGERVCLIDPPPHKIGHILHEICAVALAPDGSLVATSLRDVHVFAPPHDGTRRTVSFGDLGLTEMSGFALAVDPKTGMIAVGGQVPTVLDPRAGAVVARGEGLRAEHDQLVFTSPSSLVTLGISGTLTRWRLDGGTLRPEASQRYGGGGSTLTALPAYGRVWTRSGTVYVDAETLLEAEPPAASRLAPSQVWSTPSGEHYAVAHLGEIEVHGPYPDPVVRLLERPLAETVPDDLARAEALLGSGRYDGEVAEMLAVLRILLDERHGGEVALGPAVSLGTDTDIALGHTP
jgi:hypothetical protein